MSDPHLYADGLTWPEAPRWRNGELWVSDTQSFRLVRVRQGQVEPVCAVPGRPSGMGFLPDGRLLLASALDCKLLYVSDDGRSELAVDLSPYCSAHLNDMVVDALGRAWVGDTGFRFGTTDPRKPGRVLVFDTDRGARVAAEGIAFPNGAVIAPDRRTFYLSETFGDRISAFDIRDDGALVGRREHVALSAAPDGLCMDSEGALWVPLLFEGAFIRVLPDGSVDRRFIFEGCNAISCMIGGEDSRTLFLGVAKSETHGAETVLKGAIYQVRVEAGAAGWPC